MLSAVTFILLQGKVAVVTVLWTVHSIPDTVGVILPNAALSRRACKIALLKQQKNFFLNKKEERKNKKAVKLAPNSLRSKPTNALGCYFQKCTKNCCRMSLL